MISVKYIKLVMRADNRGEGGIIASKKPGMAGWRKHLFIFMSRNAVGAFSFFRLTPNRVVELGMQLEI